MNKIEQENRIVIKTSFGFCQYMGNDGNLYDCDTNQLMYRLPNKYKDRNIYNDFTYCNIFLIYTKKEKVDDDLFSLHQKIRNIKTQRTKTIAPFPEDIVVFNDNFIQILLSRVKSIYLNGQMRILNNEEVEIEKSKLFKPIIEIKNSNIYNSFDIFKNGNKYIVHRNDNEYSGCRELKYKNLAVLSNGTQHPYQLVIIGKLEILIYKCESNQLLKFRMKCYETFKINFMYNIFFKFF